MPKAARVHLLGPEALLATLTGDLDRALALRQAALEACAPDEHPRCQGDLADALLRMGQAEAALRACDLGLAACRGGRRSLGYRNRTAAFLHLHRARCAVALGLPLAPDALNLPLALPGPDPWLRACLLQAEATRSPEGARAALSRLPDYVRHAPIVAALLHRCLGRLGDEAAAARLVETAPFVGLSFAEAARRLPY